MHAALAQSHHNWRSWLGLADKTIRRDLKMWSVFKEVDWEELTEEKVFAVEKLFDSYIVSVEESTRQFIQEGEMAEGEKADYMEKSIATIRYQHFLQYQSLLGNVHFFQHISAALPRGEDFLKAIQKTRKFLQEEKEQFLDRKREYEIRHRTTMRYTSRQLELMDYQNLLEEVLKENPRYCDLAAALAEYLWKRELKMGVMIGAPILVSSFGLPLVPSIVAGLATGAGFAAVSHGQLQWAKMRRLRSS